MAARKNNHSFTITTHIYIATNKTNTESVGPSTYMHSHSSTSLLKSVVSFTTKKKTHAMYIATKYLRSRERFFRGKVKSYWWRKFMTILIITP